MPATVQGKESKPEQGAVVLFLPFHFYFCNARVQKTEKGKEQRAAKSRSGKLARTIGV
jgi:hypothetical protein